MRSGMRFVDIDGRLVAIVGFIVAMSYLYEGVGRLLRGVL